MTTEHRERTDHTGPSADFTDPYQHPGDCAPFIHTNPAGCWITDDYKVCDREPAGPSGLCEKHRDELRGAA